MKTSAKYLFSGWA